MAPQREIALATEGAWKELLREITDLYTALRRGAGPRLAGTLASGGDDAPNPPGVIRSLSPAEPALQ